MNAAIFVQIRKQQLGDLVLSLNKFYTMKVAKLLNILKMNKTLTKIYLSFKKNVQTFPKNLF